MKKDRLITETCDFGVIYSLFLNANPRQPLQRRIIVKISWDEKMAEREDETHSSVFEVNLQTGKMWALGRKGNQLPAERFSAAKICAWARRELAEYDS